MQNRAVQMVAALSRESPPDPEMRCLRATLGRLPRDAVSGAVWDKASHNNSAGGRILKGRLIFIFNVLPLKRVTLLPHLEEDLLVFLPSCHH